MNYSHPHTIDNGHGEELTFIRTIDNDAGLFLEVENKVQPGSGPPMHVHHLQDESLTVVQGKLGAQIMGQQPSYHAPGDTVTFGRGVAHRFWNAGEEVLVCKGWISPPDNIEYFLTEIYRSTKANGGKRPSLFDGAYLQTKYKSEFELTGIPAFVKKVLFPIVLGIGRLSGKHRRFEDAPEPARWPA